MIPPSPEYSPLISRVTRTCTTTETGTAFALNPISTRLIITRLLHRSHMLQHSLQLVKKAVGEGILLDYFIYPGHPRNVRGKDRADLMRKVTQYFEDNL